ncbi:hypothetical protein [Eremococcus coleocola]|uniref:Uncharacterized protein n=1 Tax=Eremococcus coleocola ACS-139-V-Col8 TaxID=908337 RepID=E4KPU9_9LACT|nr:hypothetical protein [Eremococcus coleocola]EFR31147.1 hypothetical protein HMPREF9257_1588 [Eremococcus coleocola ACS-139-V-Col8]
MIDEAADRGIAIMVNVVLNHVGYGVDGVDGSITDPEILDRFKGMIWKEPVDANTDKIH